MLSVQKEISYTFQAKLIAIEMRRVGDRRAISSAGDGSHERSWRWTSEQTSYLLMFYLLSCHFTLKAEGPNTRQPNDLLSHFIFPFCFSKQPLLESPVLSLQLWGTIVEQTHNRGKLTAPLFFCSSSICGCICMRYIKVQCYTELCILQIILYKHQMSGRNSKHKEKQQLPSGSGKRKPKLVPLP